MSDEQRTVETVCEGCESRPCDEPCERWYSLLEEQLRTVEDEQK